ncbi:MAG: hypothetical protein RI897_2369 [Verrucomicrobiota bacterium]
MIFDITAVNVAREGGWGKWVAFDAGLAFRPGLAYRGRLCYSARSVH